MSHPIKGTFPKGCARAIEWTHFSVSFRQAVYAADAGRGGALYEVSSI